MATRQRGSTGPGRGTSSSARPARSSRPGRKEAARPDGSGGSRFTARAFVMLIVMVLLIASYTASFRTWWQQRQEMHATQLQIEASKDAIDELKDDARRWDDPAYVEQQARDRFGWVMPGEVGYRVIDADGEVEGDVPQLSEPPSDDSPQWYDQLWRSVEVAGQEPVEPTKPAETPDAPLQDAG
ncbi:MAG: septum formation initiator family protein [Aeromicrobium sp.]|uniref:FtsB family cell division protein n=1 Tax=Aeromicrobium sp. TaxID=1871063 RepID=UPI0039E638E9